MGWNNFSIPKLQRCNRWSLGMDTLFHPTLYDGCNYLSMLGLKLIYVSERGPRYCECKVWFLFYLNTLRLRQNGRHFADDNFKCIFLNENVWIPIKISLKFVPQGPINIIPALVLIMAWRRPGDKPLSGPMMVRLPTHICVTRPQWVNSLSSGRFEQTLNK